MTFDNDWYPWFRSKTLNCDITETKVIVIVLYILYIKTKTEQDLNLTWSL